MDNGVDLIIFDCDGVLVDSERLGVRVEADLLTELGWPLSQAEVFDRFGGRPQDAIFAEIYSRLGDALSTGWHAEFEHRYRNIFVSQLAPIDGIHEVFEELEHAVVCGVEQHSCAARLHAEVDGPL